MSKYAFTFKKDNIFVEFMAEDKEVVERQFQIWVADADEYARKHPKAPKTEPAPKATRPEAPEAKTADKKSTVDEKPKKAPEAQPKPVEEKVQQATEEKTEEVFDKASTLLKTINNIQSPESEEEKPAETVNFEEVLEQTIENPTFEPAKTKDKVFLNLVNSKNTTDKFHYLIITSYYLSEFEKLERFSLKQINSKLMNNLSEVVDHTMLQNAINQSLIELIPDLTGTSAVGEYRLTRAGEEFFAKI